MDYIDVVVEIPLHTNIKYELNKESGMLVVDRLLQTLMVYPANYGFIPKTLAKDGDPLDALVVCPYQLIPGCSISSKPIGIIYMEDEKGLDEKIICVPSEKVDKTYVGVEDMDDLPKQTVDEFIHFFEHYKDLEVGKYVKILGTGNANDACKLIESYKISS